MKKYYEYLILNNYPNKFIDKYIRKRTIEIYQKNTNNITLNETNPVAEPKKNKYRFPFMEKFQKM